MQQQPPNLPTIPYYYTTFSQEASNTWHPDTKPGHQFNPHWENNVGFHVTGSNNFGPGPGQVQSSGGQNRQVGPQQPPQPPPTSTPPGIHGDINKQSVMPNQQNQMNYVQSSRPINPTFQIPRAAMQQTHQLRPHNRGVTSFMPMQQVLAAAPSQAAIVQTFPVMYGQPRQSAPYASQQQYLFPQQFYQANPSSPCTPYYQAGVLQQTYQGISGTSSSAAGQQGSGPLMRAPIVPQAPAQPLPKPEGKKQRPNAIKIIDPDTNEEVPLDNDNGGNNNNVTPMRSNDSSARETPQPNAGTTVDNTVAAAFAAKVAQAISSDSEPTLESSTVPESDIKVQHKQPHAVLSNLSSASQEFVPRSLIQALQPESMPVPLSVPTVSAETNSPVIEIRPKEPPHHVLKNPIPTPVVQSPLRVNSKKQKSSENERQQSGNVATTVTVPTPPVENRDTNRKDRQGAKTAQKEENASPAVVKEKTRSAAKQQSPEVLENPVSATNNIPVQSPTVEEPVLPPAAPAPVPQHTNGETPVDSTKTTRAKNKKPKSNMRELNRKGVDKEGSDMDAFTTEPEPSVVAEEKERPTTPVAPPAQAVPEPSVHIDKIKEDLSEKEDKLVAAKNEENEKFTALNTAEEEPTVPVKSTVPQLTLKHSYKEDQWSPLNPEGKKKYDRDFLMDLKREPQSNQKPDNLPDVVSVIRDSSSMGRNQMGPFMNTRGDGQGILPSFVTRNSQSQRGPLPKRGSQQGSKGGKGSRVIHMTLSLHEDVKLKTTENAWKPQRLEADVGHNDDTNVTEELYKTVRGILNKLTPQKFDTLMNKFKELRIDSEEKLTGVINLIFDKAVDEPNFSKWYANMCKICSKLEVSKLENGHEQKVNFRKILITRCQTEFESSKSAELDTAKHLEEIKNCTDPEQKKELQLAFEEKERSLRMKSVGNIRFIGELFKLGMLTQAIMYRCIEHLLMNPEEESLECLCKLLTTIGKDLEFGQANNKTPQVSSLNQYFQKMSDLAQKREGSKVSSRVRFMLQDVIELRLKKWVPRREDNNPKTIDQITKEAERENLEITLALNQPPPRMNRPNDRQDDRKRGNRGGNINNNNNNIPDDGWVSVTRDSRHHHNKFTSAFEASKMQNVKPEVDINSLSLGGSSQFRFSSMGKNVENKPSGFTSSNVFSALSRGGDERKPPQSGMNSSRRITPTPSIERQRMIQSVEGEGINAQRGPPSRDNSVPPSSAPDLPPELSKEKLERKTRTILEEYLSDLSPIEDVKQEIEQSYPASEHGGFVEKALQIALDGKAGAQKSIGTLLCGLMDYNLFSTQVLVEQLSLIYEMADDIAIDVPKVWETQAQVLVPILVAEKMDFSHLKAALSPVLKTVAATKLLVPILTLLAQEKGAGPGFVRKLWDASKVNLTDFLPSDVNVDAFVKENGLDYLTGEPKYDVCTSHLSIDEIQEKMLRLMQTNQPYEKINDFILNSAGDRVSDHQFIRALITSICQACITGQTPQNLDTNKWKQYGKLIKRFVDHTEERELACLSAIHVLMSRLEHPQGLIHSIFSLLWEDNLISCDSFLKWKEDPQEKLENKGVSVLLLSNFFNNLLNDDETDEETS